MPLSPSQTGATEQLERVVHGWRMARSFAAPDASSAFALAAALRAATHTREGQPADIVGLVEAFGWRHRYQHLTASADGTCALLVPSARSGFLLVVDPDLAMSEAWQVAGLGAADRRATVSSMIDFRLAHELAHTFFYDRAFPPRRLLPQASREEAFCDMVARALLVPRAAEWSHLSAAALVEVARSSKTALEVLCGAVVDAGRGITIMGGRDFPGRPPVQFCAQGRPASPALEVGWRYGSGREHFDCWRDGNRFLAMARSIGDLVPL